MTAGAINIFSSFARKKNRNFLKLDEEQKDNTIVDNEKIIEEKNSLTNEDIQLIYNYIEKQKSYLFNIIHYKQ